MPAKKAAKKAMRGMIRGQNAFVRTATAAGKRLDKLFGTQNMTAFPLQKPTKVKRKSKGGGGK